MNKLNKVKREAKAWIRFIVFVILAITIIFLILLGAIFLVKILIKIFCP